jgi:hypothetical protein
MGKWAVRGKEKKKESIVLVCLRHQNINPKTKEPINESIGKKHIGW